MGEDTAKLDRLIYMKPFLLIAVLALTVGFAAAPAKMTVGIKDGKPNPSNADIQSRKVDLIYFLNQDAVTYELVFTDKTNGSPFQAPGTTPANSKLTLSPFRTASGPYKVHDLAKPGKYPYDLMAIRGGKSSRAGGGTVIVE